jgi:hypothetical protein
MVKRASDEGESTNSGQGHKRRNLPRWHSNHKVNLSSQSGQCPIDFTPTGVVEYPGSKLEKIKPGIFYVPELTNQVAFDSFIMDAEYVYTFRFAIDLGHSIKPGIVPFFFAALAPGKDELSVFVIPNDSEISCPQPHDPLLQGLLEEMELFSAELDPGKCCTCIF